MKPKSGQGDPPPRYSAVLLACLLYAALIVALRLAPLELPLAPEISGFDQKLYSSYLDALARVQSSPATQWAVAFASTVATECFVLGLLLRRRPFPAVAKAGLIANLATHPLFWYLLTGVEHNYAFWVVAFELVIAGLEAAILALVLPGLRRCHALGLSLVANGASFLLGLAAGIR